VKKKASSLNRKLPTPRECVVRGQRQHHGDGISSRRPLGYGQRPHWLLTSLKCAARGQRQNHGGGIPSRLTSCCRRSPHWYLSYTLILSIFSLLCKCSHSIFIFTFFTPIIIYVLILSLFSLLCKCSRSIIIYIFTPITINFLIVFIASGRQSPNLTAACTVFFRITALLVG